MSTIKLVDNKSECIDLCNGYFKLFMLGGKNGFSGTEAKFKWQDLFRIFNKSCLSILHSTCGSGKTRGLIKKALSSSYSNIYTILPYSMHDYLLPQWYNEIEKYFKDRNIRYCLS